ncbi:hypothetical protein KO506_03830 [Polaribacter vadi]|uniref:hypothetical protein n=1 Tax=Polaribacter TaxID=52959 RepID=UPI001C07FC34|nr:MULTISPECIES: hypothetical protein [Polaribacter]MBU3010519.1 hypothetical protein [Polaribacter vadi]MDO6740327.1 hypothetical protein [Polaribacter sp. 1_MG-2023]
MRGISFFSDDTYLSIPNRKNPKVILAVGNKTMAKNSVKIYNPFSLKAKLFKKIVRFSFINFNTILTTIFDLDKNENSEFIKFLNDKFQIKFTASIYNATLKDKVVIQLQSEGLIFGYVKYPIDKLGLKNIKNEIKAIEVLSEKGVLNLQMKSFEFKGTPFFILPELQGNIANIPDNEVLKLVESFKKEVRLKLKEQPRVLEIRNYLNEQNLILELQILESVVKSSTEYYHEVYEHGDFAPWNIVKTKEGLAAFDFEYFAERGLEYLDIIKYHFQVGRLLKGKNEEELYQHISEKINIKEIKEILSLFLLKEIMSASQQKKSADFEKQMLNFINA